MALDVCRNSQTMRPFTRRWPSGARKSRRSRRRRSEAAQDFGGGAGKSPGTRRQPRRGTLLLFHQGRLGQGAALFGQGERRGDEVAGCRGTGVGARQGRRQSRPGRCVVGRGGEGREQGQARHAASRRLLVPRGGGRPAGRAGEVEVGKTACTGDRDKSPQPHGSGKIPPPLAVAPFDEKAVILHQKRWANYLRLSVEVTNSIGMKLALIPPGEFNMGSPPEADSGRVEYAQPPQNVHADAPADEGPRHRVRITQAVLPGHVPCDTGGVPGRDGLESQPVLVQRAMKETRLWGWTRSGSQWKT